MKTTFEKGPARATMYLGDCREILPTLPPADYISQWLNEK